MTFAEGFDVINICSFLWNDELDLSSTKYCVYNTQQCVCFQK